MHLETDFFEQWYQINLKIKYFPFIHLYTNKVFRFSVIFCCYEMHQILMHCIFHNSITVNASIL